MQKPQMLDTYQNKKTLAHLDDLSKMGFSMLGMYYFKSSAFKELLDHKTAQFIADHKLSLADHQFSIVSIFESGSPTSPGYFTTEQGRSDAHVAFSRAQEAHQPLGTAIYYTVDYDASVPDLNSSIDANRGIIPYARAFRETMITLCQELLPVLPKATITSISTPTPKQRYNLGVYGSGMVCRRLFQLGLVNYTWLSQSTGFLEYDSFLKFGIANITQGETQVLSFPSNHQSPTLVDCDLDFLHPEAAQNSPAIDQYSLPLFGEWCLPPTSTSTSTPTTIPTK